MPRSELAGPILNAARRGGTGGRTLEDILTEVSPSHWGQSGRIPDHTGAAIIGIALIGLSSTNLIDIKCKNDNKLSRRIKSLKESSGFSDGYEMARILKEQGEENIIISIKPTLSTLQRFLGFSVTDMIEAAKGGSIRVNPFFGEPDQDSSLKSDVFVLMPFSVELRPVYEDHIKPTCQMAGLSCRRADDFFRVGQIMHDIWSAVFLSDWIIADCTGRNPNVFYEIGIAHTMGKRVILITQDENDVPFDIRHIRFFKYEFTPRGMKHLENSLTATLTSAS